MGAAVGSFKSAATKRINIIRGTPGGRVWQRDFRDRVIRTDRELTTARHYIVYNALKWEDDRNNPANW